MPALVHDTRHVVRLSSGDRWGLVLCVLGMWAVTSRFDQPAQATEPTVDFRREVLPILADRCFACHGPDAGAREADLRLDQRDAALANSAFIPGDASASELIRRIDALGTEELMPPASSKKSLSNAERNTLRRWIEQGAPYRSHWSFEPVAKPEPPTVRQSALIRGPLDQFVLVELESKGRSMLPEADRHTLVRRLALDLTGLPPTPEVVMEFIHDNAPNAYEKLVDHFLSSPQFGERMALPWLDAARYADTNGYSIDGGRHAWLWRDWVINAFNENMRYDIFLREQLAGDLLPDPTDAQRIATGFQRNNMVTHEGGTLPEENIVNYNADRVRTLGESILGLTVGCAQCHDHKYDPITQKDYYRLYAFFNSISDQGLDGDRGTNPGPIMQGRTVLPTDEVSTIRQSLAQYQHHLDHPQDSDVTAWIEAQQKELKQLGEGFELHPMTLLKVSTPNAGAGFEISEQRFVEIGFGAELIAFDVSMRMPSLSAPITGLRVVFHRDPKNPQLGLGYGQLENSVAADVSSTASSVPTPGTFMVTTLSANVASVAGDQVNLHRLLRISRATADSWHPAYRPDNVRNTRTDTGWAPASTELSEAHLTTTWETPVFAQDQPYLTAQLNFGFGRTLTPRRFEFLAMCGRDEDSTLPQTIMKIIRKPQEEYTSEERGAIREYYAKYSDEEAPARMACANLEERLRVLTSEFPTMVMAEAEAPRVTHLLHRGDYAQPGDTVTPGVPECLPPLPPDAPANRLGLAQWITMPTHPLTARVAVNRIWQQFFGTGIVSTPADFGTQGAYPSHPELLDWLAGDFVDSQWDIKRLVRQIVTSATYRQSSQSDTASLEMDPGNRLLGRGPRFRLPAELIRDNALAISGLLVPRVGGPSVNPYAPGDLWREISHFGSTGATAQSFVQDHGEKLYRRSIYSYWKRTSPPPSMTAFDAPSREVCSVSRPTTITPLQTLVLLNDTQFVEAARHFAQRIMRQSEHDSERIAWAFVAALARPPSDMEMSLVLESLQRERTRYAQSPAAAGDFLEVGESAFDSDLNPVELAAWGQIATLLLNLSETITRN
jgi:mono/diheme cytochrome c family protein